MVDGNSIVVIKGISGSGKSTRVHYFLTFLELLGGELQPFEFVNINGKKDTVGVYSPDFNMVFVGKFYYDGGSRRWQGYDAMTGRLGKAPGLSHFMLEMTRRGIAVLIDGAGVTATHRLRPECLMAESEMMNILYVRYDYKEDQREEYRARITYRSGEPPKGDQMWRKNHNFKSDCEKAIEEAKLVNQCGGNAVIADCPYDAPVWDLGVRILEFFGLNGLIEPYKEYAEASDYIQQNSYETFIKNEGKTDSSRG